ncbi:hypothetical protein [Alkalicoccus daliensis]|uniref:YxiS n=1 Tax=Alkalicoccus daliensis TaxID=745820 RepID=A0A1G9ZH10_9BACI|nr:hypothetical protein [Alkalicoccus daliensis]SDN20650.1 hypothetical protein SAMN04488053_101102 [Alkalicoccus daliensis]
MEEHNDKEKQIIESFKQDENMMALVFAQWCINHDLSPEELYTEAYGDASNPVLHEAIALTVPKEEAGEIDTQTLLGVLAMFGNDALAEVVTKHQPKRKDR